MSAGARWEVVGLEVLERRVYLSRGMEYAIVDLHDVPPLLCAASGPLAGAHSSDPRARLPAPRAARDLALAPGRKDAALHAMADALVAATADDPGGQRGGPGGRPRRRHCRGADRPAAPRRGRGRGMADGLREIAGLPDPVGEVVRGSTLANGLELRQVRVPFGVVGIIYEARPNVTADAAGICLKSGNAVLLRGSSSALRSNTAIVGCCATRPRRPGCPPTSSSSSG